MKSSVVTFVLSALILTATLGAQAPAPQQAPPITAIRAGKLIDPETGTATANQVILVEGTRIRDVGANLAIPAGRRRHRFVGPDAAPRPRRRSQPPRRSLTRTVPEHNILLPDLRDGLDCRYGRSRRPLTESRC